MEQSLCQGFVLFWGHHIGATSLGVSLKLLPSSPDLLAPGRGAEVNRNLWLQ